MVMPRPAFLRALALACACAFLLAGVNAYAWDMSDTVQHSSGTVGPGQHMVTVHHERAVLACRNFTHDGDGVPSEFYAPGAVAPEWQCMPYSGSSEDPPAWSCPDRVGDWVMNPATEEWSQAGPSVVACAWQVRIVPSSEPPASSASSSASSPLTEGTFTWGVWVVSVGIGGVLWALGYRSGVSL